MLETQKCTKTRDLRIDDELAANDVPPSQERDARIAELTKKYEDFAKIRKHKKYGAMKKPVKMPLLEPIEYVAVVVLTILLIWIN